MSHHSWFMLASSSFEFGDEAKTLVSSANNQKESLFWRTDDIIYVKEK